MSVTWDKDGELVLRSKDGGGARPAVTCPGGHVRRGRTGRARRAGSRGPVRRVRAIPLVLEPGGHDGDVGGLAGRRRGAHLGFGPGATGPLVSTLWEAKSVSPDWRSWARTWRGTSRAT